jgi:hypothetical protein
MRAVVGVILLGWLPGTLIFRLPALERHRRAALAAEERLFWSVVLSLVWSLAGVLALAMVGRYRFDWLLIANAVVSAAIVLAFRGRLKYDTPAAPPTRFSLLPVAIALLGCWLYSPPAEYVLGGKDPGVYMNEGIQLAQSGSIIVNDPVIAGVPPAFRDMFFPSHNRPVYYGTRFMGFFIQDPDRGTVVGQFPHLFPATIALGYGVHGLTGARQAVTVWAILGLLAVYFVGARLIGPLPSAGAVGLLAINVIEVWFARYPNAEVVMQALLFAAILAFGHALNGAYRFFGPVAGLLLGIQLFLRYDAVLAFVMFAAAATLAPFARARVGWGFWIALTVTAGAGLWYLIDPMRAYSERAFIYTRDEGGLWLVAAGIGIALACRWLATSPAWSERVRRIVPSAIVVVVAGLAVYAYFFRTPGLRTSPSDAFAFRTFAWYVTPLGLAAGIAGFLLLVRRSFWRDPAFFLTFTLYSLFFFYKMRIVPEHFWSTRRFLAVTLPGLMLGIGGLAGALVSTKASRSRMAIGSVAVAALALFLAIGFWRQSTPVRRHVEYAGLIPNLEKLAARFGDRDLVIVESRNASDVHVLALPIAYIYARNVIVLNTPRPPKQEFDAFISWARNKYENIFFLGGGGTDLLSKRLTAEPIASERFQIPEYASPQDAFPDGVRRKEFDYGLYRLQPASTVNAGPTVLQIGMLDDLYVVRFHAKEQRGDGLNFRWTTNQSYVVIPNFGPAARSVTVWLSNGGRPPTQAPPEVTVLLDDQVLGAATPVDRVDAYTFAIPPAVAEAAAAKEEPPRLMFRVPTWNPHAALGVPDVRNLGVMVTKVEVR